MIFTIFAIPSVILLIFVVSIHVVLFISSVIFLSFFLRQKKVMNTELRNAFTHCRMS